MDGRYEKGGLAVAKEEASGIGEYVNSTIEILTNCHAIVCRMDEKFCGPIPEAPKTAGARSSAGLLSDVMELQGVAKNLQDRLSEWVKRL